MTMSSFKINSLGYIETAAYTIDATGSYSVLYSTVPYTHFPYFLFYEHSTGREI